MNLMVGIELGDGLVRHEEWRLDRERAGEEDTGTFPAGERRHAALRERCCIHGLQRAVYGGLALRGGRSEPLSERKPAEHDHGARW